MKLTDGQTKLAWGIGIIAIISLWIAFPLIFKYWVYRLLVTPPFTTEPFASLGPIGDIFGSLTAFFTSLTLIIVLYSAHLQKRANKDARDAMAEQLKQVKKATDDQLWQARNASNQQLKQARDALAAQLNQARVLTEQQITNANELANIQLKQSQQITAQQLALSESMHNAQMRESRHAVFSNMFNSLMNHKNELKKNILIKDKDKIKDPEYIFNHMDEAFRKSFANESCDLLTLDRSEIMVKFLQSAKELGGEKHIPQFLTTYFYFYESIVDLVKNSELSDKEKDFYFELLGNTMSLSEQVCLLWISSGFEFMGESLLGTKLFWFNFEDCLDFIVKFNDKSCFKNINFLIEWDNYLAKQKEETPA